MMDTYGRFKLMQSIRSWLLLPTPNIAYGPGKIGLYAIFGGSKKQMTVDTNEGGDHFVPPDGKPVNPAIMIRAPLSHVWFPRITNWNADSTANDYKDFVAYMEGRL